MSDERREFRTHWVVHLIVGCASVGSLLAAILLFRSQGPTLNAWGSAALAAFFVLAFVEGFVARVVLEPDTLEIVTNFRRTVVPRSDLVRAVAAKGVPISIERASGGWVKLPGTLAGPHVNTVRAWLGRASTREADR